MDSHSCITQKYNTNIIMSIKEFFQENEKWILIGVGILVVIALITGIALFKKPAMPQLIQQVGSVNFSTSASTPYMIQRVLAFDANGNLLLNKIVSGSSLGQYSTTANFNVTDALFDKANTTTQSLSLLSGSTTPSLGFSLFAKDSIYQITVVGQMASCMGMTISTQAVDPLNPSSPLFSSAYAPASSSSTALDTINFFPKSGSTALWGNNTAPSGTINYMT